MPKGYISFDEFKTQHPHKPKKFRCPRCHKETDFLTVNLYGKRMCADCLNESIVKYEKNKKPKEEIKLKYEEYEEY